MTCGSRVLWYMCVFFFFFKQKTAYEMRISDWSSDVCSSDLFKPVMFLLNIPWHEAGAAGGFFGEKIVLNEFVAYIDLGKVQDTLSPRTVAIVTFALCGFANFSSIAIQMAVTGGLA